MLRVITICVVLNQTLDTVKQFVQWLFRSFIISPLSWQKLEGCPIPFRTDYYYCVCSTNTLQY